MLFKAISDNKEVMQFGLKDNSLYLFQSTVYIEDKIQVMQLQKRLSKTSSKAKTDKQLFDNNIVKELSILQFVDKYNYNINYVD